MKTAITQKDIMFRNFQIHKFDSKKMVPTVNMMINVNASPMIELRKEANNSMGTVPHITITHIIVKAIADVLIEFPILYSFFNGSKIIDNPELVLNIPVDIENHVEYIVVRRPDSKTLIEISDECIKELEKIRNNEGDFMKYIEHMNNIPFWIKKLHMLSSDGTIDFMRQHYGNFVISNFGSFNIDSGSLALSQPMIAGLCVNAISSVISVNTNGYITKMNLPLSIAFDHRAVDGAYVGKFLNEVKKLLENPERLFAYK